MVVVVCRPHRALALRVLYAIATAVTCTAAVRGSPTPNHFQAPDTAGLAKSHPLLASLYNTAAIANQTKRVDVKLRSPKTTGDQTRNRLDSARESIVQDTKRLKLNESIDEVFINPNKDNPEHTSITAALADIMCSGCKRSKRTDCIRLWCQKSGLPSLSDNMLTTEPENTDGFTGRIVTIRERLSNMKSQTGVNMKETSSPKATVIPGMILNITSAANLSATNQDTRAVNSNFVHFHSKMDKPSGLANNGNLIGSPIEANVKIHISKSPATNDDKPQTLTNGFASNVGRNSNIANSNAHQKDLIEGVHDAKSIIANDKILMQAERQTTTPVRPSAAILPKTFAESSSDSDEFRKEWSKFLTRTDVRLDTLMSGSWETSEQSPLSSATTDLSRGNHFSSFQEIAIEAKPTNILGQVDNPKTANNNTAIPQFGSHAVKTNQMQPIRSISSNARETANRTLPRLIEIPRARSPFVDAEVSVSTPIVIHTTRPSTAAATTHSSSIIQTIDPVRKEELQQLSNFFLDRVQP